MNRINLEGHRSAQNKTKELRGSSEVSIRKRSCKAFLQLSSKSCQFEMVSCVVFWFELRSFLFSIIFYRIEKNTRNNV